MKQKINENRLKEYKYSFNNEEFPIYHVIPVNKSNKMIFFVPGLNGNGIVTQFLNYKYFDDYHLVSFDARAQGSNQCKPSRRYKKYVNDLNKVIDKFVLENDIKEINLIGESWGSAISIHYINKYKNKINKTFTWNMPYRIVNTSKNKGWEKSKRDLKMISTFLFNINTYDDSSFVEELTNNKLLIRTIRLFRKKELSNRVIIAAWLSFKPAWRILFKNKNLNIKYIQSKEDIMGDFKRANLLKQENNNRIEIFEKGFHILMFDENVQDELFKKMNDYLSINDCIRK